MFLIGLIVAVAFIRFLPFPPNFSPIAAMALFAGACFTRKSHAFAVALGALFLSDLMLGVSKGTLFGGFHQLMPLIYLSFALIVCLGFWLRQKRNFLRIAGFTFAGSVLFFISSNFGVWAFGSMYPKTVEGLVACYIAAIPFFHNSLAGDFFFVTCLFGGLAFAEKAFPALRLSGLQKGIV